MLFPAGLYILPLHEWLNSQENFAVSFWRGANKLKGKGFSSKFCKGSSLHLAAGVQVDPYSSNGR